MAPPQPIREPEIKYNQVS